MYIQFQFPIPMKVTRILCVALSLISLLTGGCNKPDDVNELRQVDMTPSDITCIPVAVRTGILAFYGFGNGSINDLSGNAHHLSNATLASPAEDRAGNPSCAFRFHNFSNPGERLTTTQSAFLDGLAQFSVSLWFKGEDSTRPGGIFESLISRDTGYGYDRYGQWSLALYDCRRPVSGWNNNVWDTTGLQPMDTLMCQRLVHQNTGIWHHLVATYDKSSGGIMKLYKDGVLQGVVYGSPVLFPPPAAKDLGDLVLGARYNGCLDDVILYNRVLDQTDVQTLFGLPACCSAQ